MDLISIIVPIYKVEQYLNQCIDSIINQSYKNLEIILVNDGSPDNCGKVCDEYAKKDNRIKVIHKENGGLSSARNAGLDVAKGEYISFIDSDDCVAENFIEVLYKLCIENNVDIAECDFVRFEDEIIKEDDDEYSLKIYSAIDMQKRIYTAEHVNVIVVWNKLYKKEIYETLRFPHGKINEDEFSTYKAFYNCKTDIAVTNKKLYFYRYNAQSIMGRKFNIKRYDALTALSERMEFYNSNNEVELYNLTVKAYLELLKWFYRLTKENVEKPRKHLKNIKNEMKKNKKEYMKLTNVDIKEKLKMELFILIPNFMCNLMNIKDKLND